MIRIVLLVLGMSVASMAHAQDQTTVSIGAATGYVFEDQAFLLEGPVLHASVDQELGNGFSVNVWGQVGEDELAREIDLTATWSREFEGVALSATVGGYFYPSGGSQPIYVASAAASIPLHEHVALELTVDRYEGALESTVYAAALAGTFGPVEVSLGKSVNRPEDIEPWFFRGSIPLGRGDSPVRLGVRGFWDGYDGESGAVLELTTSF